MQLIERRLSKIGAVAQLGERMTGSHEVDGSIPFSSTNLAFRLTVQVGLYYYGENQSYLSIVHPADIICNSIHKSTNFSSSFFAHSREILFFPVYLNEHSGSFRIESPSFLRYPGASDPDDLYSHRFYHCLKNSPTPKLKTTNLSTS